MKVTLRRSFYSPTGILYLRGDHDIKEDIKKWPTGTIVDGKKQEKPKQAAPVVKKD